MGKRPKKSRPSIGKRSTPTLKPGVLSRGLSTSENSRWVVKILQSSTHDQVTAVLRGVGYPLHRDDTAVKGGARSTAQAVDVLEFLRSPEGQEQLSIKKQQAVAREAENWLLGVEGTKAVRSLKDKLLIRTAADDEQALEQAARRELTVLVDRWLRSPAGREAIEIERKRASQSEASSVPPQDRTWVDRQVEDLGSHAES